MEVERRGPERERIARAAARKPAVWILLGSALAASSSSALPLPAPSAADPSNVASREQDASQGAAASWVRMALGTPVRADDSTAPEPSVLAPRPNPLARSRWGDPGIDLSAARQQLRRLAAVRRLHAQGGWRAPRGRVLRAAESNASPDAAARGPSAHTDCARRRPSTARWTTYRLGTCLGALPAIAPVASPFPPSRVLEPTAEEARAEALRDANLAPLDIRFSISPSPSPERAR